MKRILCTVLMAAFLFTACSACKRSASENDAGYQKGNEDGSGSVEKDSAGSAVIRGSFTAMVRDVIPDYVSDDTTPRVAVVTLFQEEPFTVWVGEENGRKLKGGQMYTFELAETKVEGVKASEMEQAYLEPVTAISRYQLKIDSIRPAAEEEWGLECNWVSVEME